MTSIISNRLPIAAYAFYEQVWKQSSLLYPLVKLYRHVTRQCCRVLTGTLGRVVPP